LLAAAAAIADTFQQPAKIKAGNRRIKPQITKVTIKENHHKFEKQ
jgi:hypothetical protein